MERINNCREFLKRICVSRMIRCMGRGRGGHKGGKTERKRERKRRGERASDARNVQTAYMLRYRGKC